MGVMIGKHMWRRRRGGHQRTSKLNAIVLAVVTWYYSHANSSLLEKLGDRDFFVVVLVEDLGGG